VQIAVSCARNVPDRTTQKKRNKSMGGADVPSIAMTA
jgi:hypothetical protein